MQKLYKHKGLTTDDVAGADAEDAAISGVAEFAAVTDGTTNVSLDAATLASEAGLTVSTTEGTVEPTSEEFALGFDITEESSFIFGNEDEFTPLDGVIEHTGTVTLETGAVDITVGDFSVGFDESRVSDTTSGFFISNGVESIIPAGAVLLDIATPEAIEATDDGLNIGTADLLVADEFASILQESGLASTDLTGADVGDASIDALLG